MENHAFDPALLGRLRALAKELQPDIFKTHNVKSNFLTALAGIHRLFPWVGWLAPWLHPAHTQTTPLGTC
jgi:hypothetical protein